jgi:ribulose-phosphate 3-epimerase
MEIVPAILAESLDVFVTRLRRAEKFAHYIQIDIMDGKFVDTQSLDPEMLNHITITVPFEIHLMVEEPLKALMSIRNPSLRKAIFHVEAAGDPLEFIKRAEKRGLDVGLAIKPETPLDSFEGLAQQVDTLLFLTVDPGRYGSPFKSEVVQKLLSVRQRLSHKTIGVDGGVSFDNLPVLYDAQVDYVCIGSRIFLDGVPEENYKKFNEWLIQLEISK